MALEGRRLVAPLLAVLALLAGCAKGPQAELRIGCIVSLTGKGESVGQYTRKGVELAVAELNSGTFKDRPIQVFYADTGSKTDQALAEFQEMVDRHHVPVIAGIPLSDEVLALAPEANQRKVVLISSNGASDDIKSAGDYVFRIRESAALQTEAMAQGLVERLGKRKIVVLHSTSANGVSYRDSFISAAVRHGAPIPSTVAFDDGKTDYRAQVAEVAAKAPEAVFLTGLDKEVGLILKTAKEAGFQPQFLISAGAMTQNLLDVAGPAAEGVIAGSARFDPDSADPVVRRFVDSYEQRFHEKAHRVAANAYDTVMILASIAEHGAADAETIKGGLYKVKGFPGVGGATTFDSFGEVDKPIALYRVQGGKFTEMK